MKEPTKAQIRSKEMTRCPKCNSSDYFYDGVFIKCNACPYTQWAKEVDGKLENVWALWEVKEKSNEQG